MFRSGDVIDAFREKADFTVFYVEKRTGKKQGKSEFAFVLCKTPCARDKEQMPGTGGIFCVGDRLFLSGQNFIRRKSGNAALEQRISNQ